MELEELPVRNVKLVPIMMLKVNRLSPIVRIAMQDIPVI